jgi:hypothetical protein
MSYDRVWICRSLDPKDCVERAAMKSAGKGTEFENESGRLYAKGDYVVLVAGRNCCFDELYLFERASDADQFYRDGLRRQECIVDGERMGFLEVSLYHSGRRVAAKMDPAEGDQDSTPEHR